MLLGEAESTQPAFKSDKASDSQKTDTKRTVIHIFFGTNANILVSVHVSL